MRCNKFKKLFLNFIDGSLGQKESSELNRHLDHCKKCKSIFSQYKKSVSLLNRLPVKKMPKEVVENISQYVNEQKYAETIDSLGLKYFNKILPRLVIPATAVAAVAIVFILVVSPIINLKEEIPIIEQKKYEMMQTQIINDQLSLFENDLKEIEKIVLSFEKTYPRGRKGLIFRGEKTNYNDMQRNREVSKRLYKVLPKIVKINREFEHIYQRRVARLVEVHILKKNKIIGEANDGMVSILNDKLLTRYDRTLVNDENKDRKRLTDLYYKKVKLLIGRKAEKKVKKEKLMPEIQSIMSSVYQDLTLMGEFIQLKDGSWVVKKE